MAARKIRSRVVHLAGPTFGWKSLVADVLSNAGVVSTGVEVKEPLSSMQLSQLFKLKRTSIYKYIDIMRDKLVPLSIKLVEQCTDLVVKHCGEHGAAPAGEMMYARVLNKPVYLIAGVSLEEIPGCILGCATHIFDSETAFLEFFVGKSV